MTKKEWKNLCRYTKNDGTFYQLQRAIQSYVKEAWYVDCYKNSDICFFREIYDECDVREWYKLYFTQMGD